MSKPGPLRRAPAILKRRAQPLTAAVGGGGGQRIRTGPIAKKTLQIVEVSPEDANCTGGSVHAGGVLRMSTEAVDDAVATRAVEVRGDVHDIRAVGTEGTMHDELMSGEVFGPDHLGSLGQGVPTVEDLGPATTGDDDDAPVNDNEVDVWDVSVDEAQPARDSVATQVDFPSRAMTALSHRLIDNCARISPTLASRASREDLIDKLGMIVEDAANSSKARFLLEQILAYRSRIASHSAFMARQAKVLMEISPRAYRHVRSADGTGLLTLPSRATLRNRYPDVAQSGSTNKNHHHHHQPEVVDTMSEQLSEEQVVLEVDNSIVGEVEAEVEADAEVGKVGPVYEVVTGQTPTYYYVLPGVEESVLLSNEIMEQHGEPP